MSSALTNTVVVVSGLPRSGTSMMMKMLEAGGLEVLTDGQRTADNDNPEGYYEFERVKQMPNGDVGWLPDAQGNVVKVISALLQHLPAAYEYRVLFMRRAYPEILASQKKMLQARGRPTDTVSDEEMTRLYQKHLQDVDAWLARQPNTQVLEVSYNAMVSDPASLVPQVNAFLGGQLDTAAMLQAVIPTLYRNRQEGPSS